MKPTIYDMENEAGVSITTVSKGLNRTGCISDPSIAKERRRLYHRRGIQKQNAVEATGSGQVSAGARRLRHP